ncbi:hypothetical protein RB195_011824 [Necator americanus]|uniref:Uncharacterized protein n=1 Tax=Necator americanus TaxID=51031 RepID=A0ABR1D526_NECAM
MRRANLGKTSSAVTPALPLRAYRLSSHQSSSNLRMRQRTDTPSAEITRRDLILRNEYLVHINLILCQQ